LADKKITYVLEVQSNGKIVAKEVSESLEGVSKAAKDTAKAVGEISSEPLDDLAASAEKSEKSVQDLGTKITVVGEQSKAGVDQLIAGFNQLTQSVERMAAAQKKTAAAAATGAYPMTQQMKAQADYWDTARDRSMKTRQMYEEAYETNKKVDEAQKKSTESTKKSAAEVGNLTRMMERLQRTVIAFIGVWAVQKILSGFKDMVQGGIEFNSIMEESRLGMASIFMAQGEFVTATGRALEAQEGLSAAMEMSTEISHQLQLDNLKTAATYQQLVKAYQQTIAPGLGAGFDPTQIREFTVAMVQAASALGLNLDMLAEETRSLLRGTITPRTTLIATALGIRNEDINRYKGDVEGLYAYVMGRLSAFQVAGEEVQKTWIGAMSNVKDVIQIALGDGFKNLFNYIKQQAFDLQKLMVTWTSKGPEISPESVDIFKKLGDGIINFMEGTKEWGVALRGLIPIFGLIYQIIRLIFASLTPIVVILGDILSLVGTAAGALAIILKSFNDILASSKTLQLVALGIGAALLGILPTMAGIIKLGTMMATTLKISSVWTAHIAASLMTFAPYILLALAALSLFNEAFGGVVDSTMVVQGATAAIAGLWLMSKFGMAAFTTELGLALLALTAMGIIIYGIANTDMAKSVGEYTSGETLGGGEVETLFSIEGGGLVVEQMEEIETLQKSIVDFKARAIQLDQKQKDELMGLVAITGQLTDIERDRLTSFNTITGLYKDSWGDLNKFLGSLEGFKLPTSDIEGLQDPLAKVVGYVGAVEQKWEDVMGQVPKYAESIQDLTDDQMQALLKVANMWEKTGLPKEVLIDMVPVPVAGLFAAAWEKMKAKMDLSVEVQIKGNEAQIASANKDYEEQKLLVAEITDLKIKQLQVDLKYRDELATSMNRLAVQQIQNIENQKTLDRMAWEDKINSADQYFAEMSGNIEEQVRLEKASLEATFEKERIGRKITTYLQEQSEISRRNVLNDEGQRKILKARLDIESKILSLKSKALSDTGNYEAAAKLTMEIYKNQVSSLVVAGKIDEYQKDELVTLNSIIALYESKRAVIQGEYEQTSEILDLQQQIAIATGDGSKAWDIQKAKIAEVQKYMEKMAGEQYFKGLQLAETDEDLAALDKLMAKIKEIIKLTTELSEAKLVASPSEWVSFYDQIETAAQKWYDKELELIQRNLDANKDKYTEEAALEMAAQEIRDAKVKLFEKENKYVDETIGNAQKIFQNASNLYDKESSQYKTLQNLKKVAQIAEIAQEVRKNLVILSGLTAVTTTKVASSGVIVAANTTEAVTAGVGAVAEAAKAPWPIGFASAAAMTAVIAGVLGIAGIAFGGGGGGGGGAGTSAPALPPSTVLGAEPGTGSESISHIFDMMKDAFDDEISGLRDIYREVRELNQNITGLVTGIVRTGGVNMEGSFGSEYNSLTNIIGDYAEGWFNVISLGILKGLGDKIGNWVSKGWNAIFGGKTSTSLEGAGIAFENTTVSDLINNVAEDIAYGYQLIKKVKDGGWFHGDSTSWERVEFALDAQITQLFQNVFQNISNILVYLAEEFGTDMNEALNYVFDFSKLPDLDLRGLDTEEMSKAINEYISNMGDIAVEDLFGPLIGQYQKLNEGLLETALRLIVDMARVNDILTTTGQSVTFEDINIGEQLGNAFDNLGGWFGTIFGDAVKDALGDVILTAEEQMIAFTEALIEMAGGLEELTDAASNYFDAFFTDAEKAAMMQEKVTAALNELGFVMPATRDEYRKLVESLDLTTEAGMEAYIALLQLASAADAVYAAQEKLISDWKNLQLKLMEITPGRESEALTMRRNMELEGADPMLRPIMEAVYAQEDYNAAVKESAAAQKDYDTAVENTIRATENLARAEEDIIRANRVYTDAVRATADAVRSHEDAVRAIPAAYRAHQDSLRGLENAHRSYADSLRAIENAHRAYADSLRAIEDANRAYDDSLRAVDDAHRRYEDSLRSIEDAHERYRDSIEAVDDALQNILAAQKAYADAVEDYARLQRLIAAETAYDVLKTRLDAEQATRTEGIEGLQDQEKYWNDELSLLSEQLRTQQDMVNNLTTISDDVKNWLASMRTGSLAPALARGTFEAEYDRLRALATAPGADSGAVSDFTSFAQQYLEFMRSYGGDYQDIFDRVLSDVETIGIEADTQLSVAQAQLDATIAAHTTAEETLAAVQAALEAAQEADEAAQEIAEELLAAAQAQIDAITGIDDRLERAQEAIDNAAEAILDAQERYIDAQDAVSDALRGIEDAERASIEALRGIEDAERGVQDALRGIADAEQASLDALRGIEDANRASADALRAIGDAERAIEDALRGIDDAIRAEADAQQAILDAIEAEAAALEAIADAEEAAAEAVQALADAQAAELEALDRLTAATENEALMLIRLEQAILRLAAAPVPGPIMPPFILPPPSPPPVFNDMPYAPQYTPPAAIGDTIGGTVGEFASTLINPEYTAWRDALDDLNQNYTAVEMRDFLTNNPSPSMFLGAGGLAMGLSLAGERGPEWVVPTYEPERRNFLQGAPQAFWDNLSTGQGGGGGAEGGGGDEAPIPIQLILDGRVVAETVARQIPRVGSLQDAIKRVPRG